MPDLRTEMVAVSSDEETTTRLSPEELAELEAGIAEADRGGMISGEELFVRLRDWSDIVGRSGSRSAGRQNPW